MLIGLAAPFRDLGIALCARQSIPKKDAQNFVIVAPIPSEPFGRQLLQLPERSTGLLNRDLVGTGAGQKAVIRAGAIGFQAH